MAQKKKLESRVAWQNFWEGDAGQELMDKLVDFQKSTLEHQGCVPSSQNIIEAERHMIKEAYKAQGMQELIDYIKALSDKTPKREAL